MELTVSANKRHAIEAEKLDLKLQVTKIRLQEDLAVSGPQADMFEMQ